MNRKLIFLGVSICYLILLVYGLTTVYSIGTPQPLKKAPVLEPENRISIAHTEIFGTLERPQVIFDHKKHEEKLSGEGCDTCHPVNDKGDIIFEFPKKLTKQDKISVMNAYHDECMECHKTMGRENKKSGPVICADCHKNEYKSVKPIMYPAVAFDFSYHDTHVKKLNEKLGKDDCGQCHHTYKLEEQDEELALVYEEGTEESCAYCHEPGEKRGPEYAAITRKASEKGLDMKRASHQQCINCHLKYIEEGDEEAGPTECIKCHTGKYKTVAELEDVPRPDRKQEDTIFIDIEESKMKGVTFNHKSHEKYSGTCRACHHESLKACKECHDLTGKHEGNGINIANAYHRVFSEHSCTGCHNEQKKLKECAGCHAFIAPMDVETMSPKKETCASCHAGKKEKLSTPQPLSTAGLDKKKVKEEVEVNVLENEYQPSKFPHLEIIDKLVKISNDSNLARYFHKDLQMFCEGCHHRSLEKAEAQKDAPPYCRNCHMVGFDRENINKTRLLSAYHRQCLGCHEQMALEKGRKCTECHEEKEGGPLEITKAKNENVVKQNNEIILNVWRPH
jgi:hypothetical protein